MADERFPMPGAGLLKNKHKTSPPPGENVDSCTRKRPLILAPARIGPARMHGEGSTE